jgi:hypothetical protein
MPLLALMLAAVLAPRRARKGIVFPQRDRGPSPHRSRAMGSKIVKVDKLRGGTTCTHSIN